MKINLLEMKYEQISKKKITILLEKILCRLLHFAFFPVTVHIVPGKIQIIKFIQ